MDYLISDMWDYLVATAAETLEYKALIILGALLALLTLVVPGRKMSDRIALAVLAAFLTLVFASTVLFRTQVQGAVNNFVPFFTWQQALATHNSSLFMQIVENIVLFIPAGIALGWLCRDARWWESVIAIAGVAMFSIGIEVLQLHYSIGMCDIDDVIDNTLGVVIGFLAMWGLCRLLRPKRGGGD